MIEKSDFTLDLAEELSALEKYFVEDGKKIYTDAIKMAVLYYFGKPISDASRIKVDESKAMELYDKIKEFEPVEVGLFLKTFESECIQSLQNYTPTLRKELSKAIVAMREVEEFYGTRVYNFRDKTNNC